MHILQNISEEELKERILSENYLDLVSQYHTSAEEFIETYEEAAPEIVNYRYAVLHPEIEDPDIIIDLADYSYSFVPKLFTTLDTTSLDASGILRTQNQPILNLNGQGVLIGFIDTGVEYTHPAFLDSDGTSRIVSIWDQTIQTGTPPENFAYGTEFTQEELNNALAREDPLSVVPTTDDNGHGTFMAGLAAGSPDPANNFTGAAPRSSIAVVKLKEAKENLKRFFLVSGDAPAYQETDIIMGINYLVQTARSQRMPLVICLGLGTNQGDHSGRSALGDILDDTLATVNISIVVAAGNEAGKAHHYYGSVNGQNEYQDVEILVGSDSASFAAELWAVSPELYSISITSPIGEVVPRIPARLEQNQVISFILENTVLAIDYEIVERRSGSQLILLRFRDPTPGIWTIRVYCDNYVNGIFNIWLPITGFVPSDIVFLQANPDTTLTSPSSRDSVITTSTYNAYDNSIFINSSRGYTSTGSIKPDIAAPGVDVYGPAPNGLYTRRTGSSAAAAITAGAAALVQNWIMTRYPNRYYSNRELKNLIIRGAGRSDNLLYPNREWGYGTLNVYRIFETIM